MKYPCPQCSSGIVVVEETAGKTVLCPECSRSVKLPRMATCRLTSDKDKSASSSGNSSDDDEEGDDGIPVAVVDEASPESPVQQPTIARAKPARMEPLAKVVKELRKNVIIPKAIDTLIPEARLKPGEAGSPGNFTLKEPTKKVARELKVKPVLMSAAQAKASREFRGFQQKIDDGPVDRIAAKDAVSVRVRPRSKIGQLFGRARDFILSDPKIRKGPAPEDARDGQLKEQYRLQEPTSKDASSVDVRPISKRGNNEVSGFHDVMDRFVPLHEFEEMEGFGEMSKEEQEAILQAQMEMEQTRVSSTNKRMFFSALVFAAPAVIAVSILGWHALKQETTVVPVVRADAADGEYVSPSLSNYSIEAVKELVREIDQASSIEELATFTRRPEATLQRMRTYYERVAFRPNQLRELHPGVGGEIAYPGNGFLWIMATTDDYHAKMLAFEKTRYGLRFDWESYVSYSEVPWTDFVDQQHARRSEFRVTLVKDNYYNNRFSDEAEFLCYRLTDPMNMRTCYGYTPRASQVAGVLEGPLGLLNVQAEEEGVAIEGTSVKLILNLRFPARSQDLGQAMISKVVCSGWVRP
ncbi:MAG: DNA-directed RNA polymerase subunit M/transcription elongation factor TFIIS [Verrucomicrobiales bacterium]|jgi:DNA-directed RNA polymerase subunit M/transcription elongation factor TFIIS